MSNVLLDQVVNQLRAVLPKYSDKYTDSISITSLTSSGAIATATSTDHGLSVGNYILIKGAKIPYVIESITRVGTQATAITTPSNQVVYTENETVEITGATQTDYNGMKTLIEPKRIKITSLTKSGNVITAVTEEDHGFIVNAKFKIKVWGSKQAIYNQEEIIVASTPTTTSFTYVVEGETTSPATSLSNIYCQALYNEYTFFFTVENSPVTPATGTIYQLLTLNGGYNGFYRVATTPDDDTFTYTMDLSSLNSPAQGTITGHHTARIDTAVTDSRAIQVYTAKATNKFVIVAVPDDTIASKNRREGTDANYINFKGNNYEQLFVETINLYLFIPSSDSLGGGDSFSKAKTERKYIIQSLIGAFFDSDYYEGEFTAITLLSDGVGAYEKGFYAHRFTIQATSYIQSPDIVDENDAFAFRRLIETYVDEDGEDNGLITDVKV